MPVHGVFRLDIDYQAELGRSDNFNNDASIGTGVIATDYQWDSAITEALTDLPRLAT
jgi:hypothetical protein